MEENDKLALITSGLTAGVLPVPRPLYPSDNEDRVEGILSIFPRCVSIDKPVAVIFSSVYLSRALSDET